MPRSFAVLGVIVIVFAVHNAAQASVVYSVAGSTYSQNFDSLPNTPQNTSLGNSPVGWTDDNAAPAAGNFSIVGWYLYHPTTQAEGGANGNQRMRIGAGTQNTGAFMSFGASGSTERALGDLASNTTAALTGGGATDGLIYMGLRLTNSTGVTLGSFTLSYDGEQWRDGGSNGGTPGAQSLTFGYKLGASTVQEAGYTSVASLGYSSPVFTNTGGGAAVDGNAAGKVSVVAATVTGLSWAPGTDLWLHWVDLNDAGNDHGLAIDNLVFSAEAAAVPEAGAFLFAGLVAGVFGVGLAARKLRR